MSARRVLLMVQTFAEHPSFPDGDDRVKCAGPTTTSPLGKAGARYSLAFGQFDTPYGTHRQRELMNSARRWWLVEAESAEAARRAIVYAECGCEVPWREGRIVASGGKGWAAR